MGDGGGLSLCIILRTGFGDAVHHNPCPTPLVEPHLGWLCTICGYLNGLCPYKRLDMSNTSAQHADAPLSFDSCW